MVNELNNLIQDILKSNVDLLFIAVKQRAKFEGWLKFELACALKKKYTDTRVEYCLGKEKKVLIDIFSNGSFIELKTPNTNYKIEDCDDKTRPITKNISSIVNDVNKLKQLNNKGYIAFVLFPLDDKEKYKNHIEKITCCLKNYQETILTINKVKVLVFTGEINFVLS